jgi:predicted transcriptional regulator
MSDKHQHGKATRIRKKVKGTQFFVRIPDEMKGQLDQIAEREERTLSAVARLAFREYIAKSASL